eukprot:8374827-Heterocapsa_arctica.AAC.1
MRIASLRAGSPLVVLPSAVCSLASRARKGSLTSDFMSSKVQSAFSTRKIHSVASVGWSLAGATSLLR